MPPHFVHITTFEFECACGYKQLCKDDRTYNMISRLHQKRYHNGIKPIDYPDILHQRWIVQK